MADFHYYVSDQNGNDSNDGLTPQTAWKTLLHAVDNVESHEGGDTYVHFGPGTYSTRDATGTECIVITTDGLSETERLIWCGDPSAKYLVDDRPGIVRFTATDEDGIPLQSYAIAMRTESWEGLQFSEFWDLRVDGGAWSGIHCIGGVLRRVTSVGISGGINGSINSSIITQRTYAYDCTFVGRTGAKNIIGVRCKAIGSTGGFESCVLYHCVGIGGDYCFQSGDYYNCLAIGGSYGYYGGKVIMANCVAFGCKTGADFTGVLHNFHAIQCGSEFDSSSTKIIIHDGLTSTNPSSIPMYIPDVLESILPLKWIQYPVERNIISNIGWAVVSNLGDVVDLSAPVEIEIPYGGLKCDVCLGIALPFVSTTQTGEVTVELQENTGEGDNPNWVTRKSKTLSAPFEVKSDRKFPVTSFMWDDGGQSGGTQMRQFKWRFLVSADEDAQECEIQGGSSGYYFHYVLGVHPYESYPNAQEDFCGNPVWVDGRMPFPGPGVVTKTSLDWDGSIIDDPPAICLEEIGARVVDVPVRGGQTFTLRIKVKHNGAGEERKPSVRLVGEDVSLSATQDSASGAWELITFSNITPTIDDVMKLYLINNDDEAKAWFADLSIE